MAMVEVAFTPLPAHVRTARLVAVAVARRSGVADSLLDEVRLAVGEACSRAVEAHRQYCPAEPVKIELTDADGRFEVVVTDAAPAAPGPGGSGPAAPGGTAPDAVAPGAVIHGAEDPAGPAPAAGAAAHADPGDEGGPAHRGPASTGPADRGGPAHGGPAPGGPAHARPAHADPPPGPGPGGPARGGPAAEAAGSVGSAAGNGQAGGLNDGLGLAVIAELADDVKISRTPEGISVCMSWPSSAGGN